MWSETQEARTNHRIVISPHVNHTTLPTKLLHPQSPLSNIIHLGRRSRIYTLPVSSIRRSNVGLSVMSDIFLAEPQGLARLQRLAPSGDQDSIYYAIGS